MSNRLDPITRSAVANANELGLVLHELNTAELEAHAQRMRAEAFAAMWRKAGRGLARLFGRGSATPQGEQTATPAGDGDVANDNAGKLAA